MKYTSFPKIENGGIKKSSVLAIAIMAKAQVFLVKICYNSYMPKLFVDKTIEINAPASAVWHVLTEHAGKTTLRLFQGDFSVMPEGEKYHRLSAEVWDRVLPKVKALAEKEN